MFLFLSELGHLASYFLAVGVIYLVGRKYFSRKNVFIGLISAFFIDIDHLFDYFLYYGFKFNLMEFLDGSYFQFTRRVILPLHSIELATFLLLTWVFIRKKEKYSWLLFLVVGLFVHLVFDMYSNRMPWYAYALLYRVATGFSVDYF
jgi:hypothetical protein